MAVNVPQQSIQFSPYQLLINVDDMACTYDSFKGDGSCNGKHNEKETVLVGANTTASNPSYGIHSSKDNTQTFNGLKIRMTNMIAAGGNLAPPFV